MTSYDAINSYYECLSDIVCGGRFSSGTEFTKLLMHLHRTEFTWTISRDQARAADGTDLRHRFGFDYIDGPCSVLEMMVALAIRCEETFMDDPVIGDRTGHWFWDMVNTLGLGAQYDARYNREYVDDVLDRFLNREYEPDGRGGLFYIRHCDRDLRNVEIWYQFCWYLGSIM